MRMSDYPLPKAGEVYLDNSDALGDKVVIHLVNERVVDLIYSFEGQISNITISLNAFCNYRAKQKLVLLSGVG